MLGTTVQPEAVRASVVCAVQNLWLAARAEGIGVGWVSIVEPSVLRAELALPAGVHPVAYLCLGAPLAFRKDPMLEEAGWRRRAPLEAVLHAERFHADPEPVGTAAERFALRDASLTKPPGSLGRLEHVARRYVELRDAPVVPLRLALPVFAADHGVTVEAVSAYGSELTAAMVGNIMAGGAAVNVLARRHGVELLVVDVGIAGDTSAHPTRPVVPKLARAVAPGTRNLRREPAMTMAQAEAALTVGAEVLDSLAVDAVGVGEVGIGNTTSAAALVCAYTSQAPEALVGRGTGIDEAARTRKVAVVRDALARSAGATGLSLAASLGGFELVAIAGLMLRARERRVPVVLDGLLAGAAALIAQSLAPDVTSVLFASHLSEEPAARAALAALGLEPMMDLGLRLGEGTGAVLGLSLLADAVALHVEMATFATAGVTG